MGARHRGALVVNDGALRALAGEKASLLPIGVVGVEGTFDKGDVVEIRDGSGRVHGRGLVNYAADACRKLAGRHSDDIDAILGWRGYDAADHARQPGDGSRLMTTSSTDAAATKPEQRTRCARPPLAAKAAGGKLARLGADGRSALLRALAAALREPGVRAELAAANAADLERAKAENVATPLVKRLGLDAGKLDGVCDGLDQLAAMPDLVGRATLRRELDDGLVLERVSAPLGLARRGVRVAPRRAGADRRPRLEERQRRAAQGRARGAGHQPRAGRGHPQGARGGRHRPRAPPCCWRGARTSPRCWACTASSR